MNLLAIHISCWLIPILVGLICAILGYLLGRLLSRGSNDDSENNLDTYKNKISKLESDLAVCKATKTSNYSADNSSPSVVSNFAAETKEVSSNTTAITTATFDSSAAKLAIGKPVKQDDLTIVEGIGPKIRELFHNHDVKTWASLAACTVNKCETVLRSGGKRFEMHKPGTWPDQAKLAAEGKWQELKEWQDKLDGGR